MQDVVARGTSSQRLGSAISTQYFFDTAEELLSTAAELLEDVIS